MAVIEAVSFQSQPLSYTLLMNPSGLFRMDQESGELSLTHPVDYESEHRLYHFLVKALEGENLLSSVTEVEWRFSFLCLRPYLVTIRTRYIDPSAYKAGALSLPFVPVPRSDACIKTVHEAALKPANQGHLPMSWCKGKMVPLPVTKNTVLCF